MLYFLSFLFSSKRDVGRYADGGIGQAGYAASRNSRGTIPEIKKTFDCPCCSVKGLDRQSLLEHVTAQHKQLNNQVVCSFFKMVFVNQAANPVKSIIWFAADPWIRKSFHPTPTLVQSRLRSTVRVLGGFTVLIRYEQLLLLKSFSNCFAMLHTAPRNLFSLWPLHCSLLEGDVAVCCFLNPRCHPNSRYHPRPHFWRNPSTVYRLSNDWSFIKRLTVGFALLKLAW